MVGKIRIETDGNLTAKSWKIYLDDDDITKFVHGIHISVEAGEKARIHLNLIGVLDFPDELVALISASKWVDE